jgi:hypothetical protein
LLIGSVHLLAKQRTNGILGNFQASPIYLYRNTTPETMKRIVFGLALYLPLFSTAQTYQSPKLLFEEDFTDGRFNGFGSGTNGNAWQFTGFAKFDTTINRPFRQAALRYIKDGVGNGWDALVLWRYNGGQHVQFDKEDDVVALQFKAFSDAAGNRISPDFGVEVAMLEDKPGAPFGHDLSFEVAQVWLRPNSPEGPLQLDPNVENTNAVYNPGTTRTHHNVANGKETSETLDSCFLSEVVWRNRYNQGRSNIEVWGKLNSSDFDVNEEMRSSTQPINPDYLQFNNLQIALFDKCRACTTATNTLLRNGTTFDNAQLGIAYCKLGITKVADFNLDYVIDEADADSLANHLGLSTGATIKKGDANNDGKTDISDASALVGFWSNDPVTSASASADYFPQTGEIRLNLQNISYIKIVSSTAGLTGPIPDLSVVDVRAVSFSDTVIGAFTNNTWTAQGFSLGNVAASGLDTSTLKIWVNYHGSGLKNGIRLRFGQRFVTGLQQAETQRNVFVDNQAFALPANAEPIHFDVVNTLGQSLFSYSGPAMDLPQHINTHGKKGARYVRATSLKGDKVLLVKKYLVLE